MTKKNISSTFLKKAISLSGLSHYWHEHGVWRITRRSASRAVAAGLFAAVLPLMPFQTLIAVFLSLLLRANLPIAIATSCLSNPFTIVPITYLTYHLGKLISDDSQSKIQVMIKDYIWNFHSHESYWKAFSAWVVQFGKAYLIGLPIVAIGSALLGYALVNLSWHAIEIIREKKIHKHKKS